MAFGSASSRQYQNDYPLIWFTDKDAWTLADAYEGVQVFGGPGSGKTSGSGKALAESFLHSGMGGLILTAKPGEPDLWRHYAQAAGRERQLVIFSPSQPWRFNFMDYELSRQGDGAGLTGNLINLFLTVAEVSQAGQVSNESYWRDSLTELLRRAIDLLAVAKGSVSLPYLSSVIQSAPYSPDQAHSPEWMNNSFCAACIRDGLERIEQDRNLHPARVRDFQQAALYWSEQFPNIAEKTRSIFVSMFSGMAQRILSGSMYDLFCTDTNITPDACEKGALILLDLPVMTYREDGRFVQVLFKYCWQQWVERRRGNGETRPVFLWADEAQRFITSYDAQFRAVAREARCATVFLTQNLPTYYSALGGNESARYATEALLGNLQTKIFHANGCKITNEWASELFAREYRTHIDTTLPGAASSQQTEGSTRREDEQLVKPLEFQTLKKGGAASGMLTEAIISQAGRQWRGNGNRTYLYSEFSQVN